MSGFNFFADEVAYREQTGRQAAMPGVTGPSFRCGECGRTLLIKGRGFASALPRGQLPFTAQAVQPQSVRRGELPRKPDRAHRPRQGGNARK